MSLRETEEVYLQSDQSGLRLRGEIAARAGVKKATLITAYKGSLVDLVVPADEASRLFAYAGGLHSLQLTQRACCDLEMLACGAFSPLTGFMNQRDYESVLNDMRLVDGTVFPIPITLSIDDLSNIALGRDISLRDPKNNILAVLCIEEIYEWDGRRLARSVFGTEDLGHPLVAESQGWGRFNLAGNLRVLKLPEYFDFPDLRLTPRQTRIRLEALGRENVVAFQTRNPMHYAHEKMTQKAMELTDGSLLLHPVVGMTRPGDMDHFTRVRTYKASLDAYPQDRVILSLVPLAMRMAGPREAVWHAIIRRNYGANHFIIGRDHASPGKDTTGRPFYASSAAQTLVMDLCSEIGVKILPFQEFAYLPGERRYDELDKISRGEKIFSLSATRVRDDFLSKGKNIPEWFTRREVAKILSESYPPRHRQGICIWFTGLSGSGKSTTAEILAILLSEVGRRTTVLDGDVVRTHLSKELGFSREDRNTNIQRIGFVASEIVRHGGLVICATVSPYKKSRDRIRALLGTEAFIEIFVDTPVEVCEGRDTKGLYAKARRGEIRDFTGIDHPYELPLSPELTLNTIDRTALQNARFVIEYLRSRGFIKPESKAANAAN